MREKQFRERGAWQVRLAQTVFRQGENLPTSPRTSNCQHAELIPGKYMSCSYLWETSKMPATVYSLAKISSKGEVPKEKFNSILGSKLVYMSSHLSKLVSSTEDAYTCKDSGYDLCSGSQTTTEGRELLQCSWQHHADVRSTSGEF